MMRRWTHSGREENPAGTDGNGFTLIEILVTTTLFVVIVGMVLVFFSQTHKNLETESGGLETQQAARIAIDELSRNLQQVGYGIDRSDPYNPARWQRAVIYAGSHACAFNADVDSGRGPLSPSTTLTFTDGTTYAGEGAASLTSGAETYFYTIDADDDGSITTADHTAAATGVFNPAAETDNPLDYGLFSRTYGYDGSGYGGSLVPVSGYLFTNAMVSDAFSDGTTPNPLFTYWLTEDLDSNKTLSDSECIVTPCPPSSTRAPLLYLWGDTDFNGVLSEAEKTALRTLRVGSPDWSRNRMASGGSYYSTTLSTDVDPSTGSAVLQVASAANIGQGAHVQVGTGGTAERFTVVSSDTSPTPDQILLNAAPENAHSAGETVVILEQTFLRAIRTVQVNFDAITPKKDYDSALAGAAVGRAGHVGTKGLEYRVRPFQRKVELINLQTGALALGLTALTPNCPTTFTPSCGGSAVTALDVFVPRSTVVPLKFILLDAGGNPMSGRTVSLTQSDASLGSFSASTVTTASAGLASVDFTPSGTNGTDTITASHTCIDSSLATTTMTTTLTLRIHELEVTITGNDCLRTFKSSAAAPSSTFTVRVKDPSGAYVVNQPVSLQLAFDPAYLPVTPDYSKVQGQLSVGGTPVGVTGAVSGSLGPSAQSTGGSTTLDGSVELTNDLDGNGARLLLTATVDSTSCSVYGTSASIGVYFYELALASLTPSATCTEYAPCTIAVGSSASLEGTLSINQVAVPSAPVTFTSDDYVKPAVSAATTLTPSSGWTTDSNGDASSNVASNGDPAITPGTPIRTHIDATSSGAPGVCTTPNITSTSLRPEFWFQGGCDVDLQQAWIKKNGAANDKLCIDIQNKTLAGGCDVSVTGVKFAVYQTDGVTLDDTFKIKSIKGGGNNAATGTCSNANEVQLFKDRCLTPNRKLNNDEQWSFALVPGECALPQGPPNPVDPQQYFVLDKVEFETNIAGLSPKRRFDVTVYFQCAGSCSGSVQSKTFILQTP